MAATLSFWDKIAGKYAVTPVSNQAVYQAKLDLTQSYYTSQSRLFEYGCGTGTTALYHAPFVHTIVATDGAVKMLDIAREKQASLGVYNVTFQSWNIDTDPLPETQFDMVMAHSVLHLVDDLPGALRKSYDLLEPHGIFVSSTVCLGSWNILFRPLLACMRLIGKAPPVTFLTREALSLAIRDAGFDILAQPKQIGGDAEFIIAKKP